LSVWEAEKQRLAKTVSAGETCAYVIKNVFVGMLVISRVYFRPLKKGVVLPLAIVKRGRATP